MECDACHYDLTGNTSGACPECGRALGRELGYELDREFGREPGREFGRASLAADSAARLTPPSRGSGDRI